MAGLNNLISDSMTKTSTLPSWYSSAQQDALKAASSGINNMPSINNTVAGQAISNLSDPNTNPFTQGQGVLNKIATGAANPWLVDSTTGAVTPNTSTALGGLFQAQNDQLKTLIPQYEAPANAGAVAGGTFGSLRGQTAADTAVTNAQANLFSDQMKAALSNQQTGVNAATGLGNIGEQGTSTMSKLGQMQQTDPSRQGAALMTLLNGMTVPTSTSEQGQLSPLSQMGSLSKIFGMTPASILSGVGGKASNILKDIFGGTGSDFAPGIDQGGSGVDWWSGADWAKGIDQGGGTMGGDWLSGIDWAPGVDQSGSVWGS
ncbi:hypothetical protein UFOVP118_56 [uncultured Caudovirales phage]|uniref:Uncharacterized protein n=1 Tax=uncultured Caudovirales phage TaxID=2100421 RepID=A0A6J5L537_9CAUD|nr:hypothetical protein UFOVP118_56 [uncultured Caudovirales phage]